MHEVSLTTSEYIDMATASDEPQLTEDTIFVEIPPDAVALPLMWECAHSQWLLYAAKGTAAR